FTLAAAVLGAGETQLRRFTPHLKRATNGPFEPHNLQPRLSKCDCAAYGKGGCSAGICRPEDTCDHSSASRAQSLGLSTLLRGTDPERSGDRKGCYPWLTRTEFP